MSNRREKHKKKISGKAVICVTLSLIIGVGAGWLTWKYKDQTGKAVSTETEQVQTTGDNVIYEGKTYQYNKNRRYSRNSGAGRLHYDFVFESIR